MFSGWRLKLNLSSPGTFSFSTQENLRNMTSMCGAIHPRGYRLNQDQDQEVIWACTSTSSWQLSIWPSGWRDDSSSASVVNDISLLQSLQTLLSDHQDSIYLAVHGPCLSASRQAKRVGWPTSTSDIYTCGQWQTMMNHIVYLCPLTKTEGNLQSLHDAGDDAVH